MKVKKRDGRLEDFNIEKIHDVLFWSTKDIKGVNVSDIEINANISHDTNLYITNIDNTSDREKISTKLTVQKINNNLNCDLFKDEINVSQFYVYASSDKFLSNQTAVKKIKKDNTESTVNQFINKLKFIEYKCDE